MRKCVGSEAVRTYMLTEDFKEDCRRAVKERVAELEARLEQELRAKMERRLLETPVSDAELLSVIHP